MAPKIVKAMPVCKFCKTECEAHRKPVPDRWRCTKCGHWQDEYFCNACGAWTHEQSVKKWRNRHEEPASAEPAEDGA